MNDEQVIDQPAITETMDDRNRRLRNDVKAFMSDRIEQFQDDLKEAEARCLASLPDVFPFELTAAIKAALDLGRARAEQDAMCFHMRIPYPQFALDEEMDSTTDETDQND